MAGLAGLNLTQQEIADYVALFDKVGGRGSVSLYVFLFDATWVPRLNSGNTYIVGRVPLMHLKCGCCYICCVRDSFIILKLY